MATLHRSGWRGWLVSLTVISVLSISGCFSDGDDGAAGPAGPAGSPSIVRSDVPETAISTITAASIADNGEMTVEFTVKDADGNGFVGLKSLGEVRFISAQLSAGANDGDASAWHRLAYERSSTRSGTPLPGELTDNGDGSYSYKFDTDFKATDAGFDADKTYRVGLQLDGDLRPSNATFDFVPSGKLPDLERKIVSESACNNCHGELRIHGGRVATDYCVLCHNPDLDPAGYDPLNPIASTEPTADFKVMVHKIHRGSDLAFDYEIGGTDYSDAVFPQDIRNCEVCHVDSQSTPQWENYVAAPTAEACGSCHDDIDFTAGLGDTLTAPMRAHPGGPVDTASPNEGCQGCHASTTQIGANAVHTNAMSKVLALRDKVQITATALTVNGDDTATVRIEIMEDLDGDGSYQAVDSLASITDFLGKYKYGPEDGALAINFDNGSGFADNHQEVDISACAPVGSGGLYDCTTPAIFGAASSNAVISVTTVDFFICYDNSPGAYTADDCGALNSGNYYDDQTPINPQVQQFDMLGNELGDDQAYDRLGASIDRCDSCHGDEQYHHGAVNLVQCKTCHNATRSSSSRTIGDLKRHVHRLHSSLDKDELDSPGFEVDYFPNNIDNCTACHEPDQIDLPAQQNSRPSIASANDGNPEFYISPTAVVCGSCHISTKLGFIDLDDDGYINQNSDSNRYVSGVQVADDMSDQQKEVVNHMVLNGAVFNATTNSPTAISDASGKEACSVCHAVGQQFGVDVVHTLLSLESGSSQ